MSAVRPATSSTSAGSHSKLLAINGVSNTQKASAQAASPASTTPASAASVPSKAYSSTVMRRIWFRLAPRVRSSTLSRVRW